MSELKPCPFCGGEPLEFRVPGMGILWRIECKNCDAGPSSSLSIEAARKVWNKRVSPAPSLAWVADYTKSDGTTDYYVMIGEGERAMSLHMHSVRGRAEYEAAEINHALTGSPKPEFEDFNLDAVAQEVSDG